MTPALLNKTCNLVSLERKVWAEAFMVVKSLRSRCRKTRVPFEEGKAVLMDAIAALDFSSDRAAM